MNGRAAMTILLVIAAFAAAGCAERAAPDVAPVATGDVENGRLLLRQFNCGSCHRITGVVGAIGDTGPPLDALRHRVYIAGSLPNTPAQLAAFIRDPQRFAPGTAMPDLGIGQQHADDMAAYLGTLE